VVIGGGTAGLVTAHAAALGAKVALVERNLLGGDCLNDLHHPAARCRSGHRRQRGNRFRQNPCSRRQRSHRRATIVARHAGEMINEITLAMVTGVGLRTLGRVIHAYPTQADAIKQAADACNRTRLTPLVRALLRRWLRP
jgi:glycine/D-amino acid oxidase-like deaminating enzyme